LRIGIRTPLRDGCSTDTRQSDDDAPALREQLRFGPISSGYSNTVMLEPAPWKRHVGVGGTAEIRAARNLVADQAVGLVGPDRAEDVRLVVSELVTNALEHGDGGDAIVQFGVDDGSFVVSVTAESSALPDQTAKTISQDQVTGRGLQIVARLSESVVVSGEERSVAVTCTFPLIEA
jgi:anti-sigma regulatory factor (Ser/Thr protein kinase)